MGRDLTGVIVFAKDEDSAYKKGRKIFKKLVKEEALWFFFWRGKIASLVCPLVVP